MCCKDSQPCREWEVCQGFCEVFSNTLGRNAGFTKELNQLSLCGKTKRHWKKKRGEKCDNAEKEKRTFGFRACRPIDGAPAPFQTLLQLVADEFPVLSLQTEVRKTLLYVVFVLGAVMIWGTNLLIGCFSTWYGCSRRPTEKCNRILDEVPLFEL